MDQTAGSVVGGLQGQAGVRVQTMCTHCNSANVQVGGLSQDLVPMFFGPYPLIGGLAVSYVLNMLPPDSVAEANVTRGPGEAIKPATGGRGRDHLRPGHAEGTAVADLRARDRLVRPLGGDAARSRARSRAGSTGSVTLGSEDAEPVDGDGDGQVDAAGVDRFVGAANLQARTKDRANRFDIGASYIDETDFGGRGAFDVLAFIGTQREGKFVPAWTREDADFTRNQYQAGMVVARRRWGQDRAARVARCARSDRSSRNEPQASPYAPALAAQAGTALFDRTRPTGGANCSGPPWGLDWSTTFGVDSYYQ